MTKPFLFQRKEDRKAHLATQYMQRVTGLRMQMNQQMGYPQQYFVQAPMQPQRFFNQGQNPRGGNPRWQGNPRGQTMMHQGGMGGQGGFRTRGPSMPRGGQGGPNMRPQMNAAAAAAAAAAGNQVIISKPLKLKPALAMNRDSRNFYFHSRISSPEQFE